MSKHHKRHTHAVQHQVRVIRKRALQNRAAEACQRLGDMRARPDVNDAERQTLAQLYEKGVLYVVMLEDMIKDRLTMPAESLASSMKIISDFASRVESVHDELSRA